MKKVRLILVTLLLILFTSCSQAPVEYQGLLNRFFSQVPSYTTNQSKTYYSYYLPPNVGNFESTITSNIFIFEETEIILNLDVASVIQNTYFNEDSATINSEKVQMISDVYVDDASNEMRYNFYYYKLDDGSYLLRLQNSQSMMVAIVNDSNAEIVLNQMVTVFKSIVINKTEIVNDFTIKNSLVYNNIFQDFFAQTPPVNSTVREMMCSMTGSSKYCDSEGN